MVPNAAPTTTVFVPNRETREAMRDAEAGRTVRFASIEGLFADLKTSNGTDDQVVDRPRNK